MLVSTTANQYLASFHDRVAGATARGIGRARGIDGFTSYERLLQRVTVSGARVLELACGDGVLLEHALYLNPAALIGCDISAFELERARNRVGSRVDLRHESVSALSLDTDSVDVVLCHMALMLITPIAPALAQIARVLRSGGSFAAVVQGRPPDGTLRTFGGLLGRYLQRERCELKLGDPRVSDPDTLWSLLCENGLTDVSIEEFDTEIRFAKHEAIAFFCTLYGPDLLTESVRSAFYDELLETISSDENGTIRCTVPNRLVCARRA